MKKERVVILGGGFGGIYTGIYLEKLKKKHKNIELTLINRDNYFVYQPMLAEVIGGSLDLLDTVSPIRKLLPKTRLLFNEIESIDLEKKQVVLAPKFAHTSKIVEYDHIIFSLGTVTDFRASPGLHEHALPFKNLSDTFHIRNQIIDAIEAAAYEDNPTLRKQLLTFVIGGGGFSGTEVVAELNDLIRSFVRDYPSIDPEEVSVILVHSKDRLLERELSASLGKYAEDLLEKRGVSIRFNARLVSASPQEAILDSGEKIPSRTIISTVPSSPNPLIEELNIAKEKGKIKTDNTLLVEGTDHMWALGDCASIPLKDDGRCPPTAQFAIREAKVLAENIIAQMKGKKLKPFYFKSLGMLGALGHHSAVAELFGNFKFSGFIAWFMWRAIYWSKLPGFKRKMRVAFTWLVDTVLPSDPVQLKVSPAQGIAQLHYETDEVIFKEGDIGDYLYIIVAGEVEILKNQDGKQVSLATLGVGEYFGEMALLNEKGRSATVRCNVPTDVLALRKSDFGLLIANFGELKRNFETTEKERSSHLKQKIKKKPNS